MVDTFKTLASSSLQLAASAGRIGFWSFDPNTGFQWDVSFYRLLGLDPESDTPQLETLLARVPAEDQHVLKEGNRALKAGDSVNPTDEFRYVGKDGGLRWIRVHRASVPGTRQYVGLFQDITDQHLAADQIKARESRLALATSAAGLGIWDWDLQTNHFTYSDLAKDICGFPRNHEVTFDDVTRITHPDDLPITFAQSRRAIDPLIRDRTPYHYRLLRDDRSIRYVVAHGEAVFQRVNGVELAVRYIGTLQDITEQIELENQTIEGAKRLKLAIEAGRMAVWNYDFRAHTMSGSPELNRLLGFPEDAQPSADDIRARYYPGERQRMLETYEKVLASGQTFGELEYRILWPDGSIRWLLMRAELQLNAARQPESAIGVLMDITERKHAQERVNVLMREVNHRSKNLLSVVQAIATQSASNEAARHFAQRFAQRLQALAANQDLLIKSNWQGIDLAELIRSQLAHYADQFGKRIRIGGPPLHLKPAAAQMLGLAFHELGTNAAKYGALSQSQGTIDIVWEISSTEPLQLSITWREDGGPVIAPSGRRGFGTTLMTTLPAHSLDAKITLEYPPDGAFWRLFAPLANVIRKPDD